MRKPIQRPFIVFSFSTTFPCLLVNQSFIPGVGSALHQPLCTQIEIQSSGLCINLYILRYLHGSFISHLGVSMPYINALSTISMLQVANHAGGSYGLLITHIPNTVLTRNYAPPFCWLGLATSMGGL